MHGRLSLISLVESLAAKLPLPVLHRQADLLLLPLVTRLVNDSDAGCRAAVGRCITAILRRVCDARGDAECALAREKLLRLLAVWYSSGESDEVSASAAALRRAASQLGLLAVDALGEGAGSSLGPSLLPLLVRYGWGVWTFLAQRSSFTRFFARARCAAVRRRRAHCSGGAPTRCAPPPTTTRHLLSGSRLTTLSSPSKSSHLSTRD